MSLQTYLERIRYIDDLIRRKATGDPKSLARKLKLSKSHTLSFIQELRNLGFPIKYSRSRKSYYYNSDGKSMIEFFIKEDSRSETKHSADLSTLNSEKMKKITGGKGMPIFSFQSDYIRLNDLTFVK